MKYLAVFGLILFCSCVPVGASTIFSTGNNPQTDEPILFHDSCSGCVDGPATTVIGHTQTTNLLTYLVSSSQLVAVNPGHNSVSTPSDVGFSDLSISIPGYTFTSIILNLTALASAADGTVTFIAHTLADGNYTSSALTLSHTGGNYYTITTDNGTQITQLDLTTTSLQHDISQIRIGGASPVPEPATFGLVGGTLLTGLVWFRRRRTS
jgi:hypothetical protein